MKKFLIPAIIILFMQLPAQISFKADKAQLFTGERFKVELSLSYPAGAVVDSSFFKSDAGTDFEKVSDSLLSSQKSGGMIKEKRILTYSAFADSGAHPFALPPFRFVFQNQPQELLSDSVLITVLPLLSTSAPAYADSLIKKVANPKDSTEMILPIMNIVKYQLSAKEKWLIFWSLLALAVVIAAIYFYLRKKKNAVAPVVEVKIKKEPAHLIAQRKLDALKADKLPAKGEYKEFSVRLSLIIREYLENRYEFNAAELTTYELKLESRKFITEDSVNTTLDRFLDNTDLVKFAKFVPLSQDLDDYFEQAEKLIVQTCSQNSNENHKE